MTARPAKRGRDDLVQRSRVGALRLVPALGLGARGLGHFHLQGEGAQFVGIQRADADHLAGGFLAAFVTDRQHHRILERGVAGRGRQRPFDRQRRDARLLPLQCGLVVAQVAPAGGAHAGAFEDGRLAVRADAGRARGARARVVHDAACASMPLTEVLVVEAPCAGFFSSQPKSAWPRMREPAATVSDPALTSPISTPPASSSTCAAPSMLPSSSPAMITRLARTPPASLAPASIVRSPWTLTSPL